MSKEMSSPENEVTGKAMSKATGKAMSKFMSKVKSTVRNRKRLTGILIIALILLLAVVYYYPMSFTKDLEADDQFSVVINYCTVEGTQHQVQYEDSDITTGQKEELIALLDQYSYRRTYNTYFSSTIHNVGALESMSIVIIHKDKAHMFNITGSGKIFVDDYRYVMKNADEFIDQAQSILED